MRYTQILFQLVLIGCALFMLQRVVVRRVETYTLPEDPIITQLHRELSILHPRLKHIQVYPSNESYTLNKQKVYLCTKDPNGQYYDRNMLVYVLCHEYAHILCSEIGHTDKFYRLFDSLLQQAQYHGLYDPTIPPVMNYCPVPDP
jgi:hypothetical protein